MDDNMIPKIVDYGFNSAIDAASIFLKYKNKNAFSSPEVLADNRNIGAGINPASDVYSFGILIWEVYTSTIPFDVPIKKIIELVVNENLRPEISKQLSSKISQLIRTCWETNSTLRPSFKLIIEQLKSIYY